MRTTTRTPQEDDSSAITAAKPRAAARKAAAAIATIAAMVVGAGVYALFPASGRPAMTLVVLLLAFLTGVMHATSF